jgi:hypothetical protein
VADRKIVSLDNSASREEIQTLLERDGCLIINNAIGHDVIDALLSDLEPYLASKPTGNGNFTGFDTKRLHSLFQKSDRIGEFIVHDKLMEVMDAALKPFCDNYQLTSNSITAIGPGETVQPMHRDDLLYPIAHDVQRNLVCTSFWALSDFTADNGATRMVPGSHLWDDERKPGEEETVQAVMPKGSVCMFLGGFGRSRITTCRCHRKWRARCLKSWRAWLATRYIVRTSAGCRTSRTRGMSSTVTKN